MNGLSSVNSGSPQKGVLGWMKDPYKRVSSSEWIGSGAVPVLGSCCDHETAFPKPGCALSWHPGIRQGASGTPDDLPEYLALTLQAGLCRVGPNVSLASHGIKNESKKWNKKNYQQGGRGES